MRADDQYLLWHHYSDVLGEIMHPPHFHALYAEHEVLINIKTLEVVRGSMPRRALALVLEWAQEHRDELLEDWELCVNRKPPKKISPLQ